MVEIERITKILCFALFALAVALGGLGMEAAHAKASHDEHSVQMELALIDLGDLDRHAHMEHHHHVSMELSENHEGHAECTMAACCHTGGTEVQFRLSLVDESTAIFAIFSADQHSDAEKDRADKPPRHI